MFPWIPVSRWRLGIIFPLIYFSLNLSHQVYGESAEDRLIEKLMMNYTTESRPVINSSDTVHVTMSLTLSQILRLDEKREVFTWVTWIEQQWEDVYLKWDPQQYDGLDIIFLGADRIWTPDLYLHNLAGKSHNLASMFLGRGRELAAILHNGTVISRLPVQGQTTCRVTLNDFPFDSQICTLTLESWAYPEKYLTYHLGEKPKVKAKDAAWRFESLTAEKTPLITHMGQMYTCIYFHLTMNRNPLFYLLNMIVPNYLLSGVMLCSFLLPAERGERMSVGMTVFMTYSVFLLLLSGIVPDSAEKPPTICIFVALNMVLTLLINAWTMLVIRTLTYAATWRPPPHWLMTCLLPSFKQPQAEQPNIHLKNNKVANGNLEQPDIHVKKDSDMNGNLGNDKSSSQEQKKDACSEEEWRDSQKEWRSLTQLGDRVFALVYSMVIVGQLITLTLLAL